jgi:hypothetical protein
MDWPSQYHAILERPAFSRFMAVPHYTYLVLKMPGPKGIITVKRSFEVSDLCDKEFHKMAQNFGMIANYGEPKEKAKKRDYKSQQVTRRTSRGTRDEETTSRSTRRRQTYKGRRESHRGISVESTKVG